VCSKAEDKLKGEKRRDAKWCESKLQKLDESIQQDEATNCAWLERTKHAWSWTWMDLCDTVRCQRKTKLTTTSLYKPTNKLKAVKRQGGRKKVQTNLEVVALANKGEKREHGERAREGSESKRCACENKASASNKPTSNKS
jgi:hypothetical protein